MRAIGDLASYMLSSRFQTQLRNSADAAAQAATTGLAPDKARHLGGSTLAVSLIDRKSELLEQHQRGVAEAALLAGATQSAFGHIQDQASELSGDLALTPQLQNRSELKAVSDKAAEVFIDTVNALNSEVAGRRLFSGTATQTRPLPDGQTMLNMLRSDVAGGVTASDVRTALDTWFNSAGAGFETMAYQGSDTGFISLPLSSDETATFGVRADSDTMRHHLEALAQAALASDPSIALGIPDQKDLLSQSRAALLQSDNILTEERSSLGLTEASIERARTGTEAELSRLASDRVSLVGIDRYEAASDFEAAQQQLEIFYRVAARQSRTSLAEYLR
ncbi:flagellin [Marivita sp.]|uniref:flagellin n=1 Tax=Marivita sp. TaxID=2003365 RepID=UPI0025BA248A|nr:flagellin [Marivita sp.]